MPAPSSHDDPTPRRHPLDPSDRIRLDARTLRGLAHPVRVRLIGMLRHDGPSTATKLGQRLGLSSAATSYHLRQLAAYGFIVDAEHAGGGRERWWRAAHRETEFDLRPDADPDVAAAGEVYLRGIAEVYAGNMSTYLDERLTLPAQWQDAGTMSDLVLRLTPAQTEELSRALWRIIEDQRRADDPADPADPVPDGARKVQVQLQIFPRLSDSA